MRRPFRKTKPALAAPHPAASLLGHRGAGWLHDKEARFLLRLVASEQLFALLFDRGTSTPASNAHH